MTAVRGLGRCSAGVYPRAASQSPADLVPELLEVLEAVLNKIVDPAPVDIQVIVHEDVAQPGQRYEPLRKVGGQVSIFARQTNGVPILFHRPQPIVGHDVVANIQNDLDRELQVPFDISDDKRILYEILPRPAAETLQQSHVFAKFHQALADKDRISQRTSPFSVVA